MPRDTSPEKGPKVPASTRANLPTRANRSPRASRSPRANRGPAAAADNRAAILEAARRLFASEGLRVPLSAIAREAGVGQGVLYRHFGGRLELAFAVFEDNLTELAMLAADPAPDAFLALWRRLLRLTVRESAFVEMVLEARHASPEYDGDARLASFVAATLPRAQEAGLVPADVTPQRVALAWRMAFGIVVTSESADQAWADLAALRLLDVDLVRLQHPSARRPGT